MISGNYQNREFRKERNIIEKPNPTKGGTKYFLLLFNCFNENNKHANGIIKSSYQNRFLKFFFIQLFLLLLEYRLDIVFLSTCKFLDVDFVCSKGSSDMEENEKRMDIELGTWNNATTRTYGPFFLMKNVRNSHF
jgi:hypothetical protein